MCPFIYSFGQTDWIAAYQPACFIPWGEGAGTGKKQRTLWPCFLETRSQREQPSDKQGADHTEQWRSSTGGFFPANLLLPIHFRAVLQTQQALLGLSGIHSGTLSLVLLVLLLAAHPLLALGGFVLVYCRILHPLLWRPQSVKVGTKAFLIHYSPLLSH